MLNQVILVGRVEREIELETLDDGSVSAKMTIVIESIGEQVDTIECILLSGVAESAAKYCSIGTVVGIKARVKSIGDHLEIHADKITFINTKEVK